MRKLLLFAAIAGILGPEHVDAKGKPTATTPGTYKDWNNLDEIEIVQTLRLSDYSKVVALPLDTSAAVLPKDDPEAMQKVLARATDLFLEGLKEGVKDHQKNMPVEARAGETPAGGDANLLLLRAKLTKIDPGSHAARYFAGMGAGAGKVALSCEVVDGKSGDVLLRIQHERRSGFGVFGGSDEKVMTKSLREVGKDIGKALGAFKGAATKH
jgi:hypothetical protein